MGGHAGEEEKERHSSPRFLQTPEISNITSQLLPSQNQAQGLTRRTPKISQRSKGRKAQYGVEMECSWGGTVRCRNENKEDSQPCLRVFDNFCYLKVMFTSTPESKHTQALAVGGLYSGDLPLLEH